MIFFIFSLSLSLLFYFDILAWYSSFPVLLG
jgi:hypothetical protein